MSVSYLESREAELRSYLPDLTARPDFWSFWEGMRERASRVPLDPRVEDVPYPGSRVSVQRVTYQGFDETRIHGWLIRPVFGGTTGRLPCLVSYHGFNGRRGSVSSYAHWTLLGVAVFAVDIREQRGDTGNAAAYSHGSATTVATKGLLDRNEYYYGAVYMDCIKAIDFTVGLPDMDPDRIIVAGTSQGGGVASAVSALDDRPCMSLVDVPSNSNIERRTEIKVAAYSGTGAFGGVNEYLRLHPDKIDGVFETLSYFDTMNMAERITSPVLAAVGLDDTICPPECYFATFNRIPAEKEITVYPFCGHGDVSPLQRERQLEFVASRLLATGSG